MELNSTLISIQGVLTTCVKETGEFTKINYKGGNENKINFIVTELKKVLVNKGFIDKHDTILKENDEKLNEIVFFLALNTQFKKPAIDSEENILLLNIIPQLSKCLLANIAYELGLIKNYCSIMKKFPLEVTAELLEQIAECLKKSKPKKQLKESFIVLNGVSERFSFEKSLNSIAEDTSYDVAQAANLIIQNVTGLIPEQTKGMKAMEIYQRMGHALLGLFDLLLHIDNSNILTKHFFTYILSASCSIVKSITVDVFCSWAEVEYDDQPLQTIVAGRAYQVLEMYQKNKLASELTSILGGIARKPKTLTELIQEADVSTIIRKINQEDSNQKEWFKAMLNTPVFKNSEIFDCLSKWYKLCDESDVDRLLGLPLPSKIEEKQLIVKCCSTLNLEALRRILTIYLHREKFIWNENTQDQLVILFNQLHPNLNEEELKNMLLLMLQNGLLFFYNFFSFTFKNSSEASNQVFYLTEEIAKIQNIALDSLLKVFQENEPNNFTVMNYIKIFERILSCQYFSFDFLLSNVLLRLLEKYRGKEETLEQFSCCVKILLHFGCLSCELTREIELFEYVLSCSSEYRCKTFLEFNSIKEEICRYCVDYMIKKCQDTKKMENKNESYFSSEDSEDYWINYYKKLFITNTDPKLVDCLLPNFNLTNYQKGISDDNFTKLLKFMPRCVSTEWQILLKEIEAKCQFIPTVNALTDVIILLCDITENQIQRQGETVNTLTTGLKFCLQNFGRFIVSNARPLVEQTVAVSNVCRVLRHMPDILKGSEGMSLVNVLPEEALRSLSKDKEFIARVVLINDKQICKVLAQRMLGN